MALCPYCKTRLDHDQVSCPSHEDIKMEKEQYWVGSIMSLEDLLIKSKEFSSGLWDGFWATAYKVNIAAFYTVHQSPSVSPSHDVGKKIGSVSELFFLEWGGWISLGYMLSHYKSVPEAIALSSGMYYGGKLLTNGIDYVLHKAEK